jgi:hypothetical protein
MTETLDKPMQGQLAFPGEIRRYILGGNSTFTLVSKKSGQRFTYKVKSANQIVGRSLGPQGIKTKPLTSFGSGRARQYERLSVYWTHATNDRRRL